MATYFLDTSAIVKRYFPELGHSWVVALCDPTQGHKLYISQAALVEVVSTICRKVREQSITIADRDQLIARFR
jgi:predicted nucleic acid-binding protein